MIGPISDFIRDLTLAHLFRNAPEWDPTVLYPTVRQDFYSVTCSTTVFIQCNG